MGEIAKIKAKTPESKGKLSFSKTKKRVFPKTKSSPANQIIHLQRTMGNQAVQRLLKSGTIQAKLKIGKPNDKYEQEADRVADKVMSMPEPKQSSINSHSSSVQRQSTCPECPEKEGIQTKPLADQITPLVQRQADEEEEPVQTKRIQRQGTEEEEEPVQGKLLQRQETEEEEEPVQTKRIQRQETEEEEVPIQTKLVQRQEAEEEEEPVQTKLQRQVEEEEEEPVQAKPASNQTPVSTSSIESSVNSLKGGGQPLPESTRSYFESRFGTDFSQVRLHTDSKAAEAAKSINAKAFTKGKDVVFGAGQYLPESSTGKRLLAHELTHVVQQCGNEIKTDFISREISKNNGIRIQRWNVQGNEAICDKSSDTLWGLSKIVSKSGMNWSCIKPVSMKSKKAKGKNYFKYLRIGDKFDISNLNLTTGPSVKLRLVRNPNNMYEKAIIKFYNGDYTPDAELDIGANAEFGNKPIHELVLSGHTGNTSIWGDSVVWDVSKSNPEKPEPVKGMAECGMLPRRCWFTQNAKVRIVGCCSEFVASPFAKAFLRKGAQVTGTNEGICGWEDYREIPKIGGGSIKIPISNYMTFDKPCHPECKPPPPASAKKCYSASCMNNQKDKWTIIKGK